ncbi:TlpA family protein disulfide reductase [Marinihelvus fidelis]|uniref:TlpA family protein disulfide reductase n=1 Tax=Marinihelvus fidelis TaxID=2613842 RepID=A0A5N0T9I8_9GAMM|nr:TlpA disulfide reductase family protein [Marinihelvus fidelis]KAA9131612.1 TlpA family protein disulfide reductase [Marinihelvus fidelis]
MNRQLILFTAVAILAATAGGVVATCRAQQAGESMVEQAEAKNAKSGLVGSHRPDWSVAGLDTEPVTAADFDGRVVLVNFWATWCAPCRAEMPMLAEVDAEYRDQGFTVVGVAMDDLEPAREFLDSLSIDYPVAVGQADVMTMSRDYGNLAGMLPYSVLIGRDGIVRWTKLGEVHREELVEQLKPLL